MSVLLFFLPRHDRFFLIVKQRICCLEMEQIVSIIPVQIITGTITMDKEGLSGINLIQASRRPYRLEIFRLFFIRFCVKTYVKKSSSQKFKVSVKRIK